MITDRNLRLPIGGYIAAALALTFMIAWSVIWWPQMAATIVTREAGGNHGASTVSRTLTATAMPALLVVLTIVLTLAPRLNAAMTRDTASPGPTKRNSARILGATLIGFGVLCSTLHVSLVGLHTGSSVLDGRLPAIGAGVLLVLLGIFMPLARPDSASTSSASTSNASTSNASTNTWVERFRAAQGPAYRIGGFALVAVGVATILAALVQLWLSMAIATIGVAAVFGWIIVSSLRKARHT